MHPSPSAETCVPFLPNFRCSIFPPAVDTLIGCSELDDRYRAEAKKRITIADVQSMGPLSGNFVTVARVRRGGRLNAGIKRSRLKPDPTLTCQFWFSPN